MNKNLLALLVSAAFLFAACGDDDSPSSPENEKEISSSSEADTKSSDSKDSKNSKSSSSVKDSGKSSSSAAKDAPSSSSAAKEESSSSVSSSSAADNEPESSSSIDEPESSSSVAANGERAATLEDLDKNLEIDGLGNKVFLSIGSRQGVFSLRIPDELWVVTYSDFENGEVEFKEGSVGIQYSNTEAALDIKGMLKEGIKLSFKVVQDTLVKYSVNGSDYTDAVSTKVSLQSGKVSKASSIMNKVYSCTDGDATTVFTFSDNSYTMESIVEEKTVSRESGYYDIHRSTLLLYNANDNNLTSSLSTYSLIGDNTTFSMANGMDAKSMDCTVSEVAEGRE